MQPGICLLFWEVGGYSYEARSSAMTHCRKNDLPFHHIHMVFVHKGDR